MEVSEETVQNLYNEIKSLRQEIKELRKIIIPSLELSKVETEELDEIQADMEKGNEVDYKTLLVEKA